MDGMSNLDMMMLDAAVGGTIMNLTRIEVRGLIRTTTESSKFRADQSRRNDVRHSWNVSQLEQRNSQMANVIRELKEIVKSMIIEQVQGAQPWNLCGSVSHKTVDCPSEEKGVDNGKKGAPAGFFFKKTISPKCLGFVLNTKRWSAYSGVWLTTARRAESEGEASRNLQADIGDTKSRLRSGRRRRSG